MCGLLHLFYSEKNLKHLKNNQCKEILKFHEILKMHMNRYNWSLNLLQRNSNCKRTWCAFLSTFNQAYFSFQLFPSKTLLVHVFFFFFLFQKKYWFNWEAEWYHFASPNLFLLQGSKFQILSFLPYFFLSALPFFPCSRNVL